MISLSVITLKKQESVYVVETNMSDLLTGLNENVTNRDYHADKTHLSSSTLKLLLKDREQFYKEKILGIRNEQPSNPAFDEGSLTHAMILEPEVIEKEFVIWEGWTKRGKVWEDFCALPENAGKLIMSKPQKVRCDRFFKSYQANKTAVSLVSGGFPEFTVCQTINDVPIKARFDYVNIDKGYIADVKTSGYAVDRDTFKQTVDQFHYQLSAALYLMVAEQFYGKKFDFYFIAISKSTNDTEVFKLSEENLVKGKMMIIEALNIYKSCLKSGDWSNPVGTSAPKALETDDYEILSI
jgi:hypothetical protein